MNFSFDLTITMSVIVTVVVAIISWIRVRNAALDKRLEEIGERLTRHETRISTAEQSLQTLPGRDEMHKIELGISEMRGDLKMISASMEGNAKIMSRLETVVSRQEEHLLKGNR